MTESRPSRKPGPALVFWGSVALFAAVFALLTYQLSVAAEQVPAPRQVQVRKVIKRRVITTIVPTPGANTVSAGPVSSSVLSSGAAPVTTGAS